MDIALYKLLLLIFLPLGAAILCLYYVFGFTSNSMYMFDLFPSYTQIYILARKPDYDVILYMVGVI